MDSSFSIQGDAIIIEMRFPVQPNKIMVELDRKSGAFYFYGNKEGKRVKVKESMNDFLKK